jgi:hypothetical protein
LRRLGLALCVIGVAAAAPAAPALAATELSVEQARVYADSYGGRTAWSSFDPARRVYRLLTVEDGKVVVTAAPTAAHPFRLDVGPGPDGAPVAVYPRCVGESCDIHLFDFASGEERRLGGSVSRKASSESLPSIWRDRIAFARRSASKSTLYLARVDGRGSPSVIPGGLVIGPSGAIALEMRGSRVVYVWSRRGSTGFNETELWSYLNGELRKLDRTGSGGAGSSTFVTPEIRGRRVYYGRPTAGRGGGNQLRRADAASGLVEAVRAPFGGIVVANWLKDRFLLSRSIVPETTDPEAECRRPGSDPGTSVCRVVVGDKPDGWTRVAGA